MNKEMDYLRDRLCEILNDIQNMEIKVNNLMIFTEDWIFNEKFEDRPHEKEYVEKQLEACKQLATTIESIIGSQSDVEKYIRMPKMDDIIVTKSLKYQLPKFIRPNKFGYLNDTRILVLDDKGYTIEKLNLPVSFTIEFPERLIGKKVAVVSYRIIPEKNQLS